VVYFDFFAVFGDVEDGVVLCFVVVEIPIGLQVQFTFYGATGDVALLGGGGYAEQQRRYYKK